MSCKKNSWLVLACFSLKKNDFFVCAYLSYSSFVSLNAEIISYHGCISCISNDL